MHSTNVPLLSCTLGLGQWRPEVWKDAGDALGNDALKGCVMPEGPAAQDPKHHGLWYNEVRS